MTEVLSTFKQDGASNCTHDLDLSSLQSESVAQMNGELFEIGAYESLTNQRLLKVSYQYLGGWREGHNGDGTTLFICVILTGQAEEAEELEAIAGTCTG